MFRYLYVCARARNSGMHLASGTSLNCSSLRVEFSHFCLHSQVLLSFSFHYSNSSLCIRIPLILLFSLHNNNNRLQFAALSYAHTDLIDVNLCLFVMFQVFIRFVLETLLFVVLVDWFIDGTSSGSCMTFLNFCCANPRIFVDWSCFADLIGLFLLDFVLKLCSEGREVNFNCQ